MAFITSKLYHLRPAARFDTLCAVEFGTRQPPVPLGAKEKDETMADEKTQSLGIYREMFRLMLSEGIVKLIHNDSTDHACVLIEELLHFAKENVLIFCRNLGSDVWATPAILSALDEALSRNGMRMRVLLQEPPAGGGANRALALLRRHGVDVRQTHNTDVTANFIVIDSKAYRLEKDVANRRGYACANDPQNAAKLVEAFDALASDSEQIVANCADQVEPTR